MAGRLINNDVESFWKKQSFPNEGMFPEFAWKKWEKVYIK
jgi:hypothetical protein